MHGQISNDYRIAADQYSQALAKAQPMSELLQVIASELADLKHIQYVDLMTLSDEIPSYGRNITVAHIGKITQAGWNELAAGFLTISRREDGTLVVVDGNHRRQAALAIGVTRMRAYIVSGLTYEEEATLFKLLNTKKAPTALQMMHADVQAGVPYAVEIARILDTYGMKLAKSEGGNRGSRGVVSTAFELEKAYAMLGPTLFEEIVATIRETWGDNAEAWQAKIIGGLRAFYSRYAGEFDRPSLILRLRKLPPDELIYVAKASGTSGESVENKMGMKIREIYNLRRTTHRLPDWPFKPTKLVGSTPFSASRASGSEAMRTLKALGKVAHKREE